MRIIGIKKLLLDAVKILDKLKIKYFVTGGYAVSVWGRIRTTIDIDIVVELIESQVELLIKELRKAFKHCYIDEDVAKEATRQEGEFNFINPYAGLKIDFWIARNGKKAEIEYKRRIAKQISGEQVLNNSKTNLKYIKKQAESYGVLKILKKILK